MNFTWFASAYDNDDALYRALTLIIMAGALTVAAGFALLILLAPLFLSLEIVAVLTILSVLLRNRYASEAYCH